MTNSCVSSKWLPHIQTGNYGMSQNSIDESKQYIFVKLTDSAYRAVEEYQKNENKCSGRAKIQVIGNGGVISFPTAEDSEGQKFEFAIDDIEGSFECIKQTQNDLDVLGTLPYKMRIQANDDVYETTRNAMAAAERTQKDKCTREIKPNQTDIGRKVKVRNSIGGGAGGGGIGGSNIGGGGLGLGSNINGNLSSNSLSRNGSSNGSSSNVLPKRDSVASNCSPHASNSNNITTNHNHPLKTSSNSRSPNPSSMSLSMSSSSRSSNNNSNLVGMPTSASSLSSALSSAAGSGTSGISNGYFRGNSPEMKNNNSSSTKNGPLLGASAGNGRSKGGGKASLGHSGNSLGLGGGSNSSSNQTRHKGNDITKRTIRERLIHLLALKPFKKPELYNRLTTEGIRDREKSLISTILKEISTMRDNTYNLKRPMWNDVNENWQFYTEQELQMLKRRKPQNLTPPISSDAGSSTSGQSPTSTHNGSPPPAVKRPPSLLDHRDRCYEDPNAKKPRISHIKKDPNSNSASSILVAPPHSRDNSNSSSSVANSDNKNQHNLMNLNMNQQNHIDTDENSVDLSYSVLDNDEFLMAGNMMGNNNNNNNNRRGGGSAPSASSGAGLKLYHNNNNKSPYSNDALTTASSSLAMERKHSSPYSSNSNLSGNRQQQQKLSPNILSSNSSSSNKQSVIYSPNNQQSQSQPQTTTSATNHSSSSSSYSGHSKSGQQQYMHPQQQPLHYQQQKQQHHHQKNTQQQQQQHKKNHQQQYQLQPHSQQQPQQQQQQQQQHQQQQLQQQPQQQQPQQPQPRYDFSNYTKIETIEQRRQYKTEFENDYIEYRQLLSQIDNVGKRFQMLADRLQSARNDADYSNIKKQIVNEYEHIRNEKAHQRDKLRFDYLHVKLAHIKNLVSEYDKMLTSAAAAAAQAKRLADPASASAASGAAAEQVHQRLANGRGSSNQQMSSATEPSSGYFPRSNKVYNMTPSPPLQRNDGGGGGGGAITDNGPAIHHQQSHHLIDDDTD